MYVWNHSKFLRVLFSNFYLSVIFTLSPLSTPRIHSLLPSVISCFFVLPFRFFALSTNFALCNALRPSNLAILAPELGPDDSQWTLLSSGIPPPPTISLGTPMSRRSLPQMCLFFFSSSISFVTRSHIEALRTYEVNIPTPRLFLAITLAKKYCRKVSRLMNGLSFTHSYEIRDVLSQWVLGTVKCAAKQKHSFEIAETRNSLRHLLF